MGSVEVLDFWGRTVLECFVEPLCFVGKQSEHLRAVRRYGDDLGVLGALVFSEQIDPTALATVALALATFGTLILMMRSLAYTKRALVQTGEEIEVSRREVEEAHRPVIVPIVDATQRLRPDRPDSPSTAPYVVSPGVLWVPIENIGSGPGLNIEISVRAEATPGVAGAISQHQAGGAIAGLGADHRLPVEMRAPEIQSVSDFGFTASYQDVAGKRWETRASYHAAERRFADISILEVDVDS